MSWELALRADGYAENTVKAYRKAVRSLADWLAEHQTEVGPAELKRQHIRGWLVEVRERHSSNTARGWFAGARHFCRWMESEGETDRDATAGIRTPAPGDPETAVLSDEALRALLATCAGTDSTARQATAIVRVPPHGPPHGAGRTWSHRWASPRQPGPGPCDPDRAGVARL